jgi:hypothetical protein
MIEPVKRIQVELKADAYNSTTAPSQWIAIKQGWRWGLDLALWTD